MNFLITDTKKPQTAVKLKNCCRLCRAIGNSFFESLNEYREGLQISELIMEVCPLVIDSDDSLPKLVCEECLEIITSAYHLQRKSVESDKIFRAQLGSSPRVFLIKDEKIEDIEPSAIVKTELPDSEEVEDQFVNCFDENFEDDRQSSGNDSSSVISSENEQPKSRQKSKRVNKSVKSSIFNPRPAPESRNSSTYEKFFMCSFCNIKLKPRQNLVRHMTNLHDPLTKPFGCKFCVIRFNDEAKKDAHEQAVHVSETPTIIFCNICNASGNYEKGMKHHMSADHDEALMIEPVKTLTRKVNSKRQRKGRFNPQPVVESEGTSSARPTWYVCNLCGMRLRPRHTMIKHMMQVHDPVKPFHCNFCISRFSNEELKNDHEKIKHANESPSIIICEICGATGNDVQGMYRHIAQDHSVKSTMQSDDEGEDESDIEPANWKMFCDLCGAGKSSKDQIENHMIIEHKTVEEVFTCERCVKEFACKQSLRRHLVNFHQGKIKCKKCNERVRDQTRLRHHEMLVHEKAFRELDPSEVTQEIKCCACSMEFKDESGLIDHLDVHRINFNTSQCSHFRAPPKNFDYFVKHSKYHAKPKTHQCLKCLRSYPYDGKFFAHLNGHKVLVQRKISCEKCGTKVRNLKQLDIHDRVKHQKQTLFICPICAKSLSSEMILNNHIKFVHNKEQQKLYQCRFCDRKLSNSTRLHRHEATHSKERPHVCEICSAAFKTIDGLKIHIKRHKGTLVKKYVCNQCSFKCTNNHRLQQHLLTHTGEKPNQCNYCENAYASKGDLIKHLQKAHVGTSVYRCEKCPAAFPRIVELREHVRVHAPDL